jgi:ParB family chromosome partitioning protein
VRSLGRKESGRPTAPSETPAVKALGQRLQRRLGARCRVVPKSAVSGRLEIEYTSLDELDGILGKIGA